MSKLKDSFKKSLKTVAKVVGKEPAEVTKAEFMNESTAGISEWDIRKSGGFEALKKLYFPPAEVDLEVKYGSKMVSSHLRKLEKNYGEALFYENRLGQAVKELLTENPIKLHAPVKPKVSKGGKLKRSVVAAISDTHFGCVIENKEMHGLNEYNWTVAARRMALYMEQIVNYKTDHRQDTDLVIQLNGDIIAGMIHNQEWAVDLLTLQFSGTVHLLSQAISYVAQHYPQVKVVCTPGNHGRAMHKADKGRATTQKWDSYENMIYVSLREIFAKSHKNVSFVIPESPFLVYKVQGHNVLQTHGDTVIKVGNPGNMLNMGSINSQINELNSSELIKPEEKIAVVSVGHVHVPTIQTLQNGCSLIINGCLSGTDPFAQSIGIFSNNPAQVIFESTEEYPVGDMRIIHVKGADSQERLDKIINPFKSKM